MAAFSKAKIIKQTLTVPQPLYICMSKIIIWKLWKFHFLKSRVKIQKEGEKKIL